MKVNRPISGRIVGPICGWLLAVLIASVHETTSEKWTGQTDSSEAVTYLLPLLIIGFLVGWLIDANRKSW